MELPQLPSPKEQDPGKESAGSESTGQQRDSRPNGTEGTRIPDTDQILAMLMKLSGMVTLGMVSPAQANVIQRNLRIILDVQNQRARASNGGQSSQALADICRTIAAGPDGNVWFGDPGARQVGIIRPPASSGARQCTNLSSVRTSSF